ncbi:hypothetical protein QQ008_13965 [Fulvivirgaceae bacterium BMA10]|uniref:Peptidase MA-like domain-containing protein n=1 Tax=Splendidivirga corallicola TaxID=3051826 RepID=A0ABT8KS72_9BACT|nr:hypothetical protein [Fulvivirgaceae bacterium BMA10]
MVLKKYYEMGLDTLSKKPVVALVILFLTIAATHAQTKIKRLYAESDFDQVAFDSLKLINQHKISPENDAVALATNLAFLHYPELKGHKIIIKYKKSVRYPITASWAFGNIFRFRKRHKYVLLLSENSFVKRVSLNKQVGVIGHEMAHFLYYSRRPSIGMVWWGLKYVFSKKFRYNFEKEADKTAIDHDLGWQLLDLSFYMRHHEVEQYMRETGKYGEK